MTAPTRRAFLGGILTLAVAPALALPQPGLTPLETALEGCATPLWLAGSIRG